MIYFISNKLSSVKVTDSNDIFLKIISFYVKVPFIGVINNKHIPVLSDSKYCILPRDSGILELRVIVP